MVRGVGSGRLLAITLATMAAAYVVWKITQSPQQATQFAFNGLSVGAVYALLAIGFTLVYSTVWFFDLYYGAAAAIGAYGVFYLRSHDTLGGQYEVNEVYVNVLFAATAAGVAAWALKHQRANPPPRAVQVSRASGHRTAGGGRRGLLGFRALLPKQIGANACPRHRCGDGSCSPVDAAPMLPARIRRWRSSGGS